MSRTVLWMLVAIGLGAVTVSACNATSGSASPGSSSDPSAPKETPGNDGGADALGGANAGVDAAAATSPAVLYVGRFEDDGAGPRAAWPGSRVVVRFDGTGVTVKLSQTDGFSGGPSWFNVVVDGVPGPPFAVVGASEEHVLAAGLEKGIHTVELEKRGEANLGTVRVEGVTLPDDGKLLPPPARQARRVEFLSDSTMDGFGVEGDRTTTCVGNAPPQFNNAAKSTAAFTAAGLGAERFLLAYSGKGLAANQSPEDTDFFGVLYGRTLPDAKGSAWDFKRWQPDVVVISLGGTDMDGLSAAPPAFAPAYDALVGLVRKNAPKAYIFATVWSQIKDLGEITTRTAMTRALTDVVSTRKAAGDDRIFFFAFPQSNNPAVDETGCFFHANAAHHEAMAALLIEEIRAQTGW